MLKSTLSALSMLVAAVLAQPALAQMLYKSIMPDGRVIYSDKPAPGAVKVETTKPDTSSKGIVTSTPKEATAVKQMEAERSQREAGADRLRAAEQGLRDAEARRAAGQEPLAGERIGTAGGASRLTDEYLRRQKSLDDAVEQARTELENARAAR
jgi:hypothetical protein